MKYLLVLAVLIVAYLLWRAPRVRPAPPPAAAPRTPALPQDMVECPVCAVHLPRPDALPGASGRLYCSHEHRQAGGN
jgi:uncharacterized protein